MNMYGAFSAEAQRKETERELILRLWDCTVNGEELNVPLIRYIISNPEVSSVTQDRKASSEI